MQFTGILFAFDDYISVYEFFHFDMKNKKRHRETNEKEEKKCTHAVQREKSMSFSVQQQQQTHHGVQFIEQILET